MKLTITKASPEQFKKITTEGTATPEGAQRASGEGEAAPVNILLFCPNCAEQHIDEAKPGICETCGKSESECSCVTFTAWLNPPHKSHRCNFCNHVWRPADVPSNGVREIQTKGARDGDPKLRAAKGWEAAKACQARLKTVSESADRAAEASMEVIAELEGRLKEAEEKKEAAERGANTVTEYLLAAEARADAKVKELELELAQLGEWEGMYHAQRERAEAAEAMTARWKVAIEGLTPSGSEFVNDPENCAAHIKARCDKTIQFAKERNEARARITELEARLKEAEKRSATLTVQLSEEYRDWMKEQCNEECRYGERLYAEVKAESARLHELITEHDGIECTKHDVLVRSAIEERKRAQADAGRLRSVVNAADKYDQGGSYPALRTALNRWRKAEKANAERDGDAREEEKNG